MHLLAIPLLRGELGGKSIHCGWNEMERSGGSSRGRRAAPIVSRTMMEALVHVGG